ncbi:MAG: hypothetical protein JRM95_05465, partial [Nitrososphaerota archaeon]|nr:hypothetical protein [Nitrososphaerota archaeon]
FSIIASQISLQSRSVILKSEVRRLDEQLEAKDREIQRLSTVMQTVLRDVAELRSKLVQAEETLGPDDGGELVPGGRIGAEDQ